MGMVSGCFTIRPAGYFSDILDLYIRKLLVPTSPIPLLARFNYSMDASQKIHKLRRIFIYIQL